MNQNKHIYLSLIIPVYNEQKIIKSTLQKVSNYLSAKKYRWEVIVVDDGSSDNTVKIAKKFINKGIVIEQLINNKGKGAALKEGVLKSRGEFIIYSDCDLSVSLTNIDKFLGLLKKDLDVVIGSRRVKGAKIKVHQPKLRENMGRVFTFLTKTILQTNLADFTCGFKGFRGEVARQLFNKGVINRWAYDSEILFLANKFGYKIYEMPVEWVNRFDSRVNLKRVVFESMKDLLLIRLNFARGVYK